MCGHRRFTSDSDQQRHWPELFPDPVPRRSIVASNDAGASTSSVSIGRGLQTSPLFPRCYHSATALNASTKFSRPSILSTKPDSPSSVQTGVSTGFEPHNCFGLGFLPDSCSSTSGISVRFSASLFRLASSISYPVSMFAPLVARQPAKISADFSVVIVTALQRR